MEYELTIKGTAAEMERIFRLLKQPDTPSSVESEVNLDVVALDFVKKSFARGDSSTQATC